MASRSVVSGPSTVALVAPASGAVISASSSSAVRQRRTQWVAQFDVAFVLLTCIGGDGVAEGDGALGEKVVDGRRHGGEEVALARTPFDGVEHIGRAGPLGARFELGGGVFLGEELLEAAGEGAAQPEAGRGGGVAVHPVSGGGTVFGAAPVGFLGSGLGQRGTDLLELAPGALRARVFGPGHAFAGDLHLALGPAQRVDKVVAEVRSVQQLARAAGQVTGRVRDGGRDQIAEAVLQQRLQFRGAHVSDVVQAQGARLGRGSGGGLGHGGGSCSAGRARGGARVTPRTRTAGVRRRG
ncbi:hypothetical protein DN402_08985 [Streptomyces sp. SW4]|nr:hypothetical protein DN402_08985 [Streptomyces sp. SW4]